MKRYAKYIAALVVLVLSSCTLNELDESIIAGDLEGNNEGKVEVFARISNYSDCTVDSRSAKEPEEAKVSSMALAVFPIVTGAIQPCVDYYYEEGQKVTFTIDRNDDIYDDATDKPYAMYIFANMPDLSGDWKGKTVEDFVAVVHEVQASYYGNADYPGLPDTGFPMMGSLGDNVSGDGSVFFADGKELILKPTQTTGNPHALPLVNDTPTDLLNIPMQAMYAKVSFNILVNPLQQIDSETQSFTMESYTLHNIPSSVDFNLGTNSDTEVLDAEPTILNHSSTVEGASGEGGINFSFYIPERYLEPTTPSESYAYPFNGVSDTDLTPEQKQNLKQRYKPLLVDGKKATYVTIKGKYLDHNGSIWDVSYDIYLGGDNYGNFDIIRNYHYRNFIEIRGLDNSSDQTVGENTIAIDHRVNIDRSQQSLPIIENLRRETLLDAHFEVRPLRIRAVAGAEGKTVTVRVEGADWIRLEHRNDNTGSTDHLANGKRKYFTSDLVTNTLAAGSSVSFTSRTANDIVWIYVDECAETYDPSSSADPVRTAKIVVSVDGYDTTSEYTINQSKLYKINVKNEDIVISGTTGAWSASSAVVERSYLIESYEEYLYNYDAEDTYAANLTFYEGMVWGLDGVQLSDTNKSIQITAEDIKAHPSSSNMSNNAVNNLVTNIESFNNIYYDFYVGRHDYVIEKAPVPPYLYNGAAFCSKIIKKVGMDSSIKELTLDKQPSGAVEYCYNKNKRNSDGTITEVHWYLPAIDEIEDVMVAAYGAFDGVFQEQDYWSCQPSYHRNYFYYSQSYTYGFLGLQRGTSVGQTDYYIDNKTHARTTRATYSYEDGVDKYDYNPSGVIIPDSYSGTHSDGTTVTFKPGYYSWAAYRSSNANAYGSEDAPGADFGEKWYVDDYPGYIFYPVFNEQQESGSKSRAEKHRVRCLYK